VRRVRLLAVSRGRWGIVVARVLVQPPSGLALVKAVRKAGIYDGVRGSCSSGGGRQIRRGFQVC
jgi:hypothetical protein